MTYQCSQASIPSCSLLLLNKKYFIPKKLQAKQENKTEKKQKKLHPGEKNIPKQKKIKNLDLRTFPPCVVFFIKKPRAPYRYNLYNQR